MPARWKTPPPAHRGAQGVRLTDIAPVDRDPVLLEPAGVLGRQRQYPDPHPVLQGGDEVPAEQAVPTGDQDVHVTASSSRTGDQ